MLKSFRITLPAVILGCMSLGSAALAASKIASTPVESTPQQQQQKLAARYRTPMQQFLIPYLQKRLAASGASSKASGTSPVTSASSGVSNGSAPNFGGFNTAPYFPTIQQASCIADPYNCGVNTELTADFDGDGKPDIAVLQNDGNLDILLNNGSGGFAPPAAYTNPNYSTASIFQGFVADVNKDGYPDIVAVDAGNGALIVYPNLKNGTFGSPTSTSLLINGNLGSVALGDVNGDGYVDAVVVSYSATRLGSTITVQTYLGSGGLTFQAPTAALTQTVNLSPRIELGQSAVALGDLNGDGRADIAIEIWEYTSTGTIVVTTALGNADGSFTALNQNAPITVPFTGSIFGTPFSSLTLGGVKIADLNNDTHADLVADCNDAVYAALGDGKGGFSSSVQSASFGGDEFELGDVNGDGIPDMVQNDGGMNVWIGKGDGTFTLPANGNTYVIDGGGFQGIALADFNGDGSVDIAQLSQDYKQVSLFAGNGKGSFHGSLMLSSATDTVPNPLNLSLATVADVQGKGYSSGIYLDYAQENLVTGVGDGQGNFTWVNALPTSDLTTLAYIEPISADLNGDGKQDILLVGATGTLSVAFSNGDGTFQAPKSLNLPTLSCELGYAAAGDINGDGIPDIVVPYPGDGICSSTVNVGSGYFVLLGSGGGKFAAPVFTSYGNELYSATLGDLNKDGKLDLVLDDAPFYVTGDFAIDLLPGNGDGTFSAGYTVNSQNLVSQVLIGDYNQDGKPDLVLFSEGQQTDTDTYATAGILLMPGNGDGSFGPITQIANGNFFMYGALADVNNDGVPDLVASLYQTPGQPNTYFGLSTLLGLGGGAFSDPKNSLQSLGSAMPFVGNFLSDNAADLLVSTGYGTALYLGQGGTSLAVTPSNASITFGDNETLTATVAASMSGRPAPTGDVSFYDGGTLLDTATLSGGSATFSTAGLAAGAHSITVAYSGDANFNPDASSTAVSVSVATLPPAFTASGTPTSLSLTRGQNGVVTITLTANATFSDTINLACSGAPAEATCTVNPASVKLTPGSSVSASVVIGTTAARSSNNAPASPFGSSGLVSLAGLLCVICGWRSRRSLLLIVPIVGLVLVTVGITGCGGSSTPTASQGSYTITVTATPASSGSAQTMSIPVTIH